MGLSCFVFCNCLKFRPDHRRKALERGVGRWERLCAGTLWGAYPYDLCNAEFTRLFQHWALEGRGPDGQIAHDSFVLSSEYGLRHSRVLRVFSHPPVNNPPLAPNS